MNDAERLLRGRHIVDLAGDFEQIDYAIERIHDLLKRSYYNLRQVIEHGRDRSNLDDLRREFDRHYMALRDITSGYLRLEGAHDRLYELMGDDEARDAAADRAANAARAAQERAEQEERDDRRRRGFRTTRDTPQPMPSLEEDVDATVMTSVSADDIRAALAAAGHVEVDNASLKDTIPPTPRASLSQLEEVLKEHTDAIADAISEANPNGTADGQDWDMPTMQVTAGDLAAALKERGFE